MVSPTPLFYFLSYSRMEKQKTHNQKKHGKEWDRKDIDDLEIKGLNVALYSVTNMSPDDQDKIYDTWFKELLSNDCYNTHGSYKKN